MKNKFSKRVLCLLCCFSLTLGVFAYKPAKAEASFVSGAAALGCAVLISTIIGTTADMAFDDVVTENIGNVIDPFVQEFVEFEGNVFENVTDLYTTIVADSNPLTAGVLALSDEAGALIARFINWLQTEKGLEAGGSSVSLIDNSGWYVDGQLFSVVYYNSWRNSTFTFELNRVYQGPFSSFAVYYNHPSFSNGVYVDGELNYQFSYSGVPSGYVICSTYREGDVGFSPNYIIVYSGTFPSSVSVADQGGLNIDDIFGPKIDQELILQPNAEFQTIPNEIPAGQSLTVNTGLTDLSFEDEQAAADSIFSAVLAGTLSPTVAVEDTATDVPGTDTDDSILAWTKKIWQAVTDLPADIASAIGGAISSALEAAFAPDAALINEMTTAFSAKFGFVDTLKQVGDDFFGMTPDTQPPVVYIHLEDAEGAYNYGGTVKALDMTWYQRYKADVDRILGGFLWIAYLWMLFRRAPDILAGAGLVLADNSYIDSVQGENGERWTFRRSRHL